MLRLGAAGVLALAGITALIALEESDPASLLRHAYLVPVGIAALRFGVAGGVSAASAAALLYGPFLLPEIERSGLTPAAVEGLVTLGILAAIGTLGGVLISRVRRLRTRYELLLAAQRTLAGEMELESALRRLRIVLARWLRASDLGLAVRDGARVVATGGAAIVERSVASIVLATGAPVFVADTGGATRPRRVFATPLLAGGEAIGVLAVERVGEFDTAERAELETLGAHIGLALENARLASRQRRFTEELELKVASATRHLEALDRAKSSFVAVVSHELRTPLTALQGFAELLATRRLRHEEVRRLAGIVRAEATRLARIVSDLLDLSRIERGVAPALRRAPIRLEEAIATTVDVFRRGNATHPIVVECGAALPRVDADPDAVERILTNLISNAVKYSPRGREVRVSARRAGAGVEVVVEDAGVGIPVEALPRIFEPYYRAPEAVSAARGTGIGLAVVKSLVEAHGGEIRVESTPCVGTRVTFSLPAVP